MGPVIFLSEEHRSDMLLDLSVLTRGERVMIKALETNVTFAVLQKLSSFNTHECISARIADTWPETREKEEAKTTTAPRAAASRPVGLEAEARVKHNCVLRGPPDV